MKSEYEKYCSNCSEVIDMNADICPKCGMRQYQGGYQNQVYRDPNVSDKEWLAVLLLCFFFGYLGVHRFYTNKIGTGVLQLVTFGGCGIWVLIDLIIIVIGSFKDGDGKLIVNK